MNFDLLFLFLVHSELDFSVFHVSYTTWVEKLSNQNGLGAIGHELELELKLDLKLELELELELEFELELEVELELELELELKLKQA